MRRDVSKRSSCLLCKDSTSHWNYRVFRKQKCHQNNLILPRSQLTQVHSLLLEVLDELLCFVVLLLQRPVLRLGLLQVLVDRVAQSLRLDPVALQLQHPLLVLLDAGLQLALLLLPALLLPLHRRQLDRAKKQPQLQHGRLDWESDSTNPEYKTPE